MKLDSKGILSLPIKIAVCFLILGLLVPPLIDIVEDLDEEGKVAELRRSAVTFRDALDGAAHSGRNVQTTFSFSIPPHGSLLIGEQPHTIILMIDGEEVGREYIVDTMYDILGEPLELSGDCKVKIQAPDEQDENAGTPERIGLEVTVL